MDDAGRLGGDERGVVDGGEEEGLHDLRLDDGGAHPQHRLVGEDHGALGHGPDVAGEAEVAEEGGEVRRHRVAERGHRGEEGNLLVGEAQTLQVAEGALQAHRHQVAPPVREARTNISQVAIPPVMPRWKYPAAMVS